MSKTKMNNAINDAKKEAKDKISTDFSNDEDNKAFYDFITNQSGEEDREQIKYFTDVFAFLNNFNDKTLTTITSDKVINDLYSNAEKEMIAKTKEFKHDEYEEPIKSYLKILKELTKSIRKIKQENNTVETTIYICESEKECLKYDPDDGKELPEVFTACALQFSKNKQPSIHCKRKQSIKNKKNGFLGIFGGGKSKRKGKQLQTRKKKRSQSRRNIQ